MNKSINTFLADQNVIQSLEQKFDYLFKCAGVTLMLCWDLKGHHIIIIINKTPLCNTPNESNYLNGDFFIPIKFRWVVTKFRWGVLKIFCWGVT